MEYNVEKHSNVLELDKVLALLSNEATMPDVAQMAQKIVPSFNFYEVQRLQNQTRAAYDLMGKFAAPTFSGAVNFVPLIKKAELGSCLTIKELLDIAKTLRIIRGVKTWRKENGVEDSTCIDEFFEVLTPNKFLEDKIFAAIKNETELNDTASAKLAALRRKMINAAQSIREKLEKIVRGGERSKFLQDAIITQRDGRFVVPVKAEFKGEFPGIVHDTSGSGSTLFIEPMAVVEVNNELRVLENEEREEVHRILFELSADAASIYESAVVSFTALVNLGLIFSKASLGYKMHGVTPKLNNEGRVILNNARHPLIDIKKVVPISLSLGVDYDSLIITGPNTGGKTVSIKTLGLLTLMAMCGLMIPADFNSEIAVFDRILSDIGDEQSIEQSLSTFSSHMVNLISILKLTTNNSLVLLDEVGAGTDPVEGAALAKAILIELKNKGAKTVATTHYAELKAYALQGDRVENASCEFSVADLKPTYRLLVGVPGSSNAFAISKRLGLGTDIIENAKTHISEEDRRFDEVIASLEKSRLEIENDKQSVLKLKEELQKEKEKSRKILDDLELQSQKSAEELSVKSQRILDLARAKANAMLNELEETKKSFSQNNAAELLRKAKNSVKTGISDIEKISDPVVKKSDDAYTLPRKLIIGDDVLIFDLGKTASIVSLDEQKGKAYVTTGNMNLWVDIKNLRLIEKKKEIQKAPKQKKVSGVTSRLERNAAVELDIRGMSVDEGIIELDRYIDNAVMSGVPSFSIIHGKGTGVLRKAVQEHLRHHKNIKRFRLGVFGEGETGVTIAELK